MLLGFAWFLRGCCFPGAASPEVSKLRIYFADFPYLLSYIDPGRSPREGRPWEWLPGRGWFPGAASPEVSPGRAALGGAAREGRPRPRRAHPHAASEHRGGFPGALPPGAAAPEAAPRGPAATEAAPRGRSSRGGPLCRPRRPSRARRSPSGAGHTGGTHGRVAPPVVDYCSGSASESCFRGLAWISAAPSFCPVCPPRFALWFCALARLRFVRLFARRPAA